MRHPGPFISEDLLYTLGLLTAGPTWAKNATWPEHIGCALAGGDETRSGGSGVCLQRVKALSDPIRPDLVVVGRCKSDMHRPMCAINGQVLSGSAHRERVYFSESVEADFAAVVRCTSDVHRPTTARLAAIGWGAPTENRHSPLTHFGPTWTQSAGARPMCSVHWGLRHSRHVLCTAGRARGRTTYFVDVHYSAMLGGCLEVYLNGPVPAAAHVPVVKPSGGLGSSRSVSTPPAAVRGRTCEVVRVAAARIMRSGAGRRSSGRPALDTDAFPELDADFLDGSPRWGGQLVRPQVVRPGGGRAGTAPSPSKRWMTMTTWPTRSCFWRPAGPLTGQTRSSRH